jgi:hypothetical protein
MVTLCVSFGLLQWHLSAVEPHHMQTGWPVSRAAKHLGLAAIFLQ